LRIVLVLFWIAEKMFHLLVYFFITLAVGNDIVQVVPNKMSDMKFEWVCSSWVAMVNRPLSWTEAAMECWYHHSHLLTLSEPNMGCWSNFLDTRAVGRRVWISPSSPVSYSNSSMPAMGSFPGGNSYEIDQVLIETPLMFICQK
jgi:hypothetical protein